MSIISPWYCKQHSDDVGRCRAKYWTHEGPHYDDVTWTSCSLKSPIIWLFNILWRPTSKKHQNQCNWLFVRGIHRSPVNSPHKWPVTREKLPFDDAIMPYHDDIIAWKCFFPHYRSFVRRIHQSLLDSHHKGPVMGALMFPLMSAWTNYWTNSWEAGELRWLGTRVK